MKELEKLMTDRTNEYTKKLVTYRLKPLNAGVPFELLTDLFNLMEFHIHPYDADGEPNPTSQAFIEKYGADYLEKLSYDEQIKKVQSEVKLDG